MHEVTGDLWGFLKPGVDAICITTNGELSFDRARAIMGQGCALEARQRFPHIDGRLADCIKHYGNRPFKLVQDDESHVWIVSFPTKGAWRRPADTDLIVRSAQALVTMTDRHAWQHVYLPRPGAGPTTGRLWWPAVRSLLNPILDDRFTAVGYPE